VKKFQAPVIGGFRKMITLPPTSVGTTIAEVGAGTITLSQLAAAINNILQGSGSVTTGSAQAANLVLGPGLAGGGTLVGNVPLRLTAPIPWGIMEDGAEGDMGPPGAVGSTGPQGPQGIPGTGGSGSGNGPTLWIPEDTSYDDFLIPGPAGAAGATGATGPQGPQGPSGTGSGSGGGGTTMFMVHEDPPYDDLIQLGVPNVIGPYLTVLNSLTVQGSTTITNPADAALISIISTGPAGTITMGATGAQVIQAPNGSNFTISAAANGVQIQMSTGEIQFITGSTQRMTIGLSPGNVVIGNVPAGQSGLVIAGASGTSAFIATASGIQIGTPKGGSSGEMGSGTANVSGNYFINGVPIQNPIRPGDGAYMSIAEDQYWEEEIYKGPTAPVAQGGTFVGTLTGVNAVTTAVFTYSIVGGNVATLRVGNLTGTCSTPSNVTVTGLPNFLQPAATQLVSCIVENSGNFAFGAAQLTPGSGTIMLYVAGAGLIPGTGQWTTATTVGLLDWSIAYPLN